MSLISGYPLNSTSFCLPEQHLDHTLLLEKPVSAALSNLSYLLNAVSPNLLKPNLDQVMQLVQKIPTAAVLLIPNTVNFVTRLSFPAIRFPDLGANVKGGAEAALGIRSVAPVHILEEQTFKSANIGAVALFAHQNRFVHLGIALGQYLLKLPSIGLNVTHAGIVAEKSDDKAISLYEIPGPGFRISKMDYALNDLKLDAQLLFFDPHLLLPEAERGPFINHLLQISKTFIDHAEKAEEQSDYNLQGIARLSIESPTFLKSDWISLLDDLVEYHLLTEGDKSSYISKRKQYFCSEFVFKKIHLARLMQKHPEISEQIKVALKAHDLTDPLQREQVTERLYQQCAEGGKFEELLRDPLFFMPSRSIMPAHLMQFAETHHLPLYRVENPNSELEKGLEVSISRWLSRFVLGVAHAMETMYHRR